MLSEKEKNLIQINFFRSLNFLQLSKPIKPSKTVVSCVYAFEMSNGTVKIGITKNIKSRIFSIKASSGLNIINFYHTEFGPHNFMLSVERACQKKFKNNKTQGEFFNITFCEACTELDKYNDKILLELKAADQKFLEELEYFWELEKAYFESKENTKTAPKVEKEFETQKQPPEFSPETVIKAFKDIVMGTQILSQYLNMLQRWAMLNVISLLEKAYGMDFYGFKETTPAVEKKREQMLTPSQIGALTGKSAQYVNKRLCVLGFQKKDFRGGYILTDKGREYGRLFTYRNDNGHKCYQIKWDYCIRYVI